MLSQTTGGGGIMLSGGPSVRPSVVRSLTPISRNAIFLYLVEGFQ